MFVMGSITEDLLRRRAEHNDGMLNGLQEISLAGQSIERIALLNQLCRHLRVLHLQNNLLCRVEGLNRLKDLHTLNLAVNNLARIDGLDRCESLARLDLTLNFIGVAGLATLASLAGNELLRELTLVGNSCTSWPGYRPYVLGVLPQLTRLDGQEVTADERADAVLRLPQLRVELEAAAAAEEAALTNGGPEALGRSARPAAPLLVDMDTIPETGCNDEDGQLRRPWCPATRMLEHREQAVAAAQANSMRRRGHEGHTLEDAAGGGGSAASARRPLTELPPLSDGEPLHQRNDGDWEFSLDESADGRAIVLEVDVGRFLDTSLIKADVQPRHVRLLIKGRMLALILPCEVRPDAAAASRSQTSGRLTVTMPKEDHHAALDITCLRPAVGDKVFNAQGGNRERHGVSGTLSSDLLRSIASGGKPGMQRAAVAAADCDGKNEEDELPPL